MFVGVEAWGGIEQELKSAGVEVKSMITPVSRSTRCDQHDNQDHKASKSKAWPRSLFFSFISPGEA